MFETLLHVGVPFHGASAAPSTGSMRAIPVAWRRSKTKLHCHRALADSPRHALDRSAADSADTEDPGPARLEVEPPGRQSIAREDLEPGSSAAVRGPAAVSAIVELRGPP